MQLTDKLHKELIECARDVLMPSQTAKLAKVPPKLFYEWLKKGREDQDKGEDTQYSHLVLDYDHAVAKEIKMMLETVKTSKRNWQSALSIIEAVARDEFGKDAPQIAEALEKIKEMENNMQKYFATVVK